MFGFLKRLFGKRIAASAPTDSDIFELKAGTRNSSWSLCWKSGRLEYREMLPPLEIFPTPGSTRDEKCLFLSTTSAQWDAVWDSAHRTSLWSWSGDYSNSRGGESWQLTMRRGGTRMSCAGNNQAKDAPPHVIDFLDAVVRLAGTDVKGPARLLESIRRSIAVDRELGLATALVDGFFQAIQRRDQDAAVKLLVKDYDARVASGNGADAPPFLQHFLSQPSSQLSWNIQSRYVPEELTSFEYKGILRAVDSSGGNPTAHDAQVNFHLWAEKDKDSGVWRVSYFSTQGS